MACENPLRIVNPRYKKWTEAHIRDYSMKWFKMEHPPDYQIDVPCGRCHSCEKRRMRDFQIRLLYEYYCYPTNSYFITLTFDQKSLERFKDNPNKAVLLFLDRFRKSVNNNKQIRHWIVPEFGKDTHRLHYHGILFNLPLGDFSNHRLITLLENAWKYGFVDISLIRGDGAPRYVSKYVTKSLSGFSKLPRVISSHGIGSSYLNKENLHFHKPLDGYLRPYIIKNGYKIPLPRYYADKIFTEEDKVCMLLDRTFTDLNGDTEYIWEGVKYPTEYDYLKARLQTFNDNLQIGLSFKKPTKK